MNNDDNDETRKDEIHRTWLMAYVADWFDSRAGSKEIWAKVEERDPKCVKRLREAQQLFLMVKEQAKLGDKRAKQIVRECKRSERWADGKVTPPRKKKAARHASK